MYSDNILRNKAETVTSTVSVIASKANRTTCVIQNNGSESIYIGFDDQLTLTNGFCIKAGDIWEIPSPHTLEVYARSASGSVPCVVVENGHPFQS